MIEIDTNSALCLTPTASCPNRVRTIIGPAIAPSYTATVYSSIQHEYFVKSQAALIFFPACDVSIINYVEICELCWMLHVESTSVVLGPPGDGLTFDCRGGWCGGSGSHWMAFEKP